MILTLSLDGNLKSGHIVIIALLRTATMPSKHLDPPPFARLTGLGR